MEISREVSRSCVRLSGFCFAIGFLMFRKRKYLVTYGVRFYLNKIVFVVLIECLYCYCLWGAKPVRNVRKRLIKHWLPFNYGQ